MPVNALNCRHVISGYLLIMDKIFFANLISAIKSFTVFLVIFALYFSYFDTICLKVMTVCHNHFDIKHINMLK